MDTKKIAQTKYTDEQTELIKQKYLELGNEGISEIATLVQKSEQSVRSKLVREGVYKKLDHRYRPKKTGQSKKEIIRDLAQYGLNPSKLDGLQGATKPALNEIKNLIEKLMSKQS